jgi:Sec-independent protein translocase protein TatA
MKVVEKLKGVFVAVMEWLGAAKDTVENVQDSFETKYEEVASRVDAIKDKVDAVVDEAQGEIEAVKSMLDKATDEEK